MWAGEKRGRGPALTTRRKLLKAGLGAAALVFATGHSPYRQWVVYRRRHLVIATNRADPPSHPLGVHMAAVLVAELPASRARVARAPDAARIASLIDTEQLDVALLRRSEAFALLQGHAPFAAQGPVALRALFVSGDHVLVCRDDFPARHAYLVARTLAAGKPEAGTRGPEGADPHLTVPLHPGARAYFEGRPMPAE